jgi:hypothetical protein
MIQDNARFKIRRRNDNDHPVHSIEAARGHTLVINTILSTHDGSVTSPDSLQVAQRTLGVVGLHGEDNNVIFRELQLGRVPHRPHTKLYGFVWGFERQPLPLKNCVMLTAANEYRLVAVLE